jgi:FAD/FMN-containing dehydrogenase
MTAAIDVTTHDGGRVALSPPQLIELGRRAGTLLRRGDAGWADAVRVWNGMVAKTPALVLQPASAQEVAAAVDFARERGLLLGVKGGGHHIAGTSIVDGGLTIDLSRLRGIRVEPAARRVHVGAGCLLKDVDQATQAHGLAVPLGFISEVGVAGLTLGGGLGYLTRRFGWTVDNLEEAEVVTADGQIRVANRKDHADLFWALRGGGGNFGVVTRFTFRLHAVGPTVWGGLIAWPFERAAEIMQAYRSLTAAAPRELAVWLVLLRAPPAPFVPEVWHGRQVCGMAVCYSGALDRAEEALAPIRSLNDPVFDLLEPQPYAQVQSYLDATEPSGKHYYWKTDYLAALDEGFLLELRAVFADCPIPDADMGVLHLGGALNERDEGDGAVGNRDARFVFGVKGLWEADERDAQQFRQWVRGAWQRLHRFSTGRTYVNFQTDDEGDDRIRAAYGANYRRLVDLKSRYDPDNLFRSNRNIAVARGRDVLSRKDSA